MKQLSLLLFLLCLTVSGAGAATLSGTVTVASTSQPVANHVVYVSDSFSLWSDSAFTNSSGVYSFNIPSGIVTGNRLWVQTMGCTSMVGARVYPNGSNLSVNFFSCNPTTTPAPSGDTLRGTVSLGGAANNGQARIYLIIKSFDTMSSTWMLHPFDSFVTAASGGSFTRVYSSTLYFGQLLIKAALLPSHPSYAAYLPTYYGNSSSWSGATVVNMANFNSTAYNINMTAGTNPGGPGFIGGNVLLGANKTAGVGDPLPARIIILANAANKPVAYTYSDANGHFEFRNIPLGSYKLYGDAGGKNNPALSLSLTTAAPQISDVFFDENDKSFTGRIGALHAGTPAALTGIKAYPNPATAYVEVSGLASVNGDKIITLRSITGMVISTVKVNAATARMETVGLPAGNYILEVVTEGGTVSFPLLK